MGQCSLFWGGASSARIATLGIPQDLTSKSDHNTGGQGASGGQQQPGRVAQQEGPPAAACGILFGHLPMNLTGPGFSSLPPPR